MRFGFSESEALDLPVDRFEMYSDSVGRIEAGERRDNLIDLVTAIAGSLTGKGIKEAVKSLSNDADGVEKPDGRTR